jgi:hypothetical protein
VPDPPIGRNSRSNGIGDCRRANETAFDANVAAVLALLSDCGELGVLAPPPPPPHADKSAIETPHKGIDAARKKFSISLRFTVGLRFRTRPPSAANTEQREQHRGSGRRRWRKDPGSSPSLGRSNNVAGRHTKSRSTPVGDNAQCVEERLVSIEVATLLQRILGAMPRKRKRRRSHRCSNVVGGSPCRICRCACEKAALTRMPIVWPKLSDRVRKWPFVGVENLLIYGSPRSPAPAPER